MTISCLEPSCPPRGRSEDITGSVAPINEVTKHRETRILFIMSEEII